MWRDCEVMDFDGEDMSFMMLPILTFMSTGLSTLVLLRPQKDGHNRKKMEVEGPCHDLLDHCSQWAELLTYQEDNMSLG